MVNRFSANVYHDNKGFTDATGAEIAANVKLMAASPDLLAACEALLDPNVGANAAEDLARAAISKARSVNQ